MERNNKDQGQDQWDQNQTIQRINETKIWFFEKISKINKPLTNMTQRRREKIQINKY
jgi:hypothetical protein